MGKLVDELLAYLANNSNEQLAKDFDALKEFNEIGPEVTSFIEQSQEMNKIYDSLPEVAVSYEFGNPEFTLDFFVFLHNLITKYFNNGNSCFFFNWV